MILVWTNRPFKGGDITSGIRAITGVIHRLWSYLRKPTVRKHLNTRIITIVILTDGKITGIYFCNDAHLPW
jgi:hypothetical protein